MLSCIVSDPVVCSMCLEITMVVLFDESVVKVDVPACQNEVGSKVLAHFYSTQ